MTEEIRTTSATGGQKGVKAERFSLMPRAGLAWVARVFGFGASKYADHNWRHGYEWSKSFDALERHIQAAKDGETYDEESGLPHLAHAGFHVLVLLTWLDEQGEGADNPMDDRWPAAMERMRRAKEEAAEAARQEMVSTGTLTESVTLHVGLGYVRPEALSLMFGEGVPEPEAADQAADIVTGQGALFATGGTIRTSEIPVEDLRM